MKQSHRGEEAPALLIQALIKRIPNGNAELTGRQRADVRETVIAIKEELQKRLTTINRARAEASKCTGLIAKVAEEIQSISQKENKDRSDHLTLAAAKEQLSELTSTKVAKEDLAVTVNRTATLEVSGWDQTLKRLLALYSQGALIAEARRALAPFYENDGVPVGDILRLPRVAAVAKKVGWHFSPFAPGNVAIGMIISGIMQRLKSRRSPQSERARSRRPKSQ